MPKTEQYTLTIDGKETVMNVLVATEEENVASLERYPLFTATVSYFATGEGATLMLFVARAEDEQEFVEKAQRSIDPYFMEAGANIYRNTIPDDNVWSMLAPDWLKTNMPLWLEGKTDTGNLKVYLEIHQNFS